MTRLLGEVDLPAPINDRWFEDYVPGSVYEFGHASLSETEIVAFARDYDPQSIHTDPAGSATGPFGGLIASGVHTIAACMRLYVDHYISHVASLASPGLDEIRWPRPVRPGDRLRIRITITEARASRSKPDQGLVHSSVEALNQDDEVVLSFTAMNFFARRPILAPTTLMPFTSWIAALAIPVWLAGAAAWVVGRARTVDRGYAPY